MNQWVVCHTPSAAEKEGGGFQARLVTICLKAENTAGSIPLEGEPSVTHRIVGFCLVPDRACWIRPTASRAGCRWPCGSGVSAMTQRFSASGWSTIGLMGPAANRFFLT